MAAGNYPDYLQRLIRTTQKNPNNGQHEESFEAGAWLWCRVEIVNGRRQSEYGGDQTGGDVTMANVTTAVDGLTLTAPRLRLTHQGEGRWDVDDVLARLAPPADAPPPLPARCRPCTRRA